ncbi:hypothetical protein RO3G_00015 [Rhizopus delemar RA 99-880]|uniref:Uncharacterized protein n=1 Tax=Rhizopus delemar (strain RA 99-880 / ATCC MYA-4621 / FGSC 9543 / NRRL 43880) TaxID=246409 RepID=I1BGI1_RHIO9|nr:hypothetical protein RO3G_00015 [Rhizopus delemar RA 99-880]|eukprot:EIE75311.1 hypothetical protein RO3G_00015 [Rhizopus delemar RA 99-880]
MDEPFDLSIHADLNFTEVLCTHFPRNPMQQQQSERNTAFLTTLPILHNMFIDCNDVIDMQWIEKQTSLTGDVKWDGVAFLIKNKFVIPLFVELSGGINYLKIYFESLFYFGEYYVKRTYFELVCPTTPKELKTFVEKIPYLFQYHQALHDQI